MGQCAALRTRKIESFEELKEAVVGIEREVVQLDNGKFQGELSHGLIGDLPIDVATFNLGVRTRGGTHPRRIGIGMLTETTGRVTRSSYESYPGDVLVLQPGREHEGRYHGGASLIVITVTPADIEASFGTEAELCDRITGAGRFINGNVETLQHTIPQLRSLIAGLGQTSLNAEAAEFWKRSVIEAMTANVRADEPSRQNRPLPSALRVVRQVEEYLDTRDLGPIHISQICSQLHVSRRTLHRAFHEVLGIGPIAFLRCRRLGAVHTTLRTAPADRHSISDLALQFGFQNLGRFAGYYHQLFGEYPSETRKRPRPQLELPTGQIS